MKLEVNLQPEKLYDTFKLKANNYQWAEVYSDSELREAILEKKWNKLNAKAHLKLVDGNIVPMNKEMPEKELYEGNKIVTFQSLLEPEIKGLF